ncbi:MAG TPA: class II aldolase/adducin family protein [Candidatus Pacearchaeota archaeon]|nr:class II aldolase/adducin family protein [Candidatus Pacearchaeota archaeon]
MQEGYIKFSCNRIGNSSPKNIININRWRDKLYSLKLIGMYENGVGFGNISIRHKKGFIITGSKTGGIERLTNKYYTKVTDYNFEKNSLNCTGEIDASSESLTHAAVYQSDSEIKAVIHVHNLGLWEKLIDKIPTTNKKVEFGTPEMAKEILRLYQETDVKKKKILVMGGHKEGIICFGKSLDEAGSILIKYYNQ